MKPKKANIVLLYFFSLSFSLNAFGNSAADQRAYSVTLNTMKVVEQSMLLYKIDNGAYTDNLEDLFFGGYVTKLILDGWQRELLVVSTALELTISSLGKDGKKGGDRFDKDHILVLDKNE